VQRSCSLTETPTGGNSQVHHPPFVLKVRLGALAVQTTEKEGGHTLTAYQAFFRQTFNELRDAARAEWDADTANAGGKFLCPTNVIVKSIGERWRAMDAAEVEAFADKTGSLAPGKHRRGAKRKRRNMQKGGSKRTGPKRAMTAYQLFFRVHEGQLSGKTEGYTRAEGMTQNVIVRTIGERWRALANEPDGRSEWTKLEAEDKQRYAKELAATPSDTEQVASSLAGLVATEEDTHEDAASPESAAGSEDDESSASPPAPSTASSLLARYQELSAAAAAALGGGAKKAKSAVAPPGPPPARASTKPS
jgi:hypothetical protein